jgi:hypothetical protein
VWLEDPIAEASNANAGFGPSPISGISRNVLLLSAVSLLTDVSSEMVYPLVPLFLSGTLGASPSIIGAIEGFAEATASIFKWIFGALSDRWGKRKAFCLAGYGLAACTKPLLAAASAWPLVLFARVTDRFGKGLRGSPRDALIAESTPPDLRGRAFGFHRSGDSIETPPDISRLQEFWEWRLADSKDREELQEFGWWIAEGKFSDDWLLERLIDTLKKTEGAIEADTSVLDALAALVVAHPRQCGEALMLIVKSRHTELWLLGSSEKVRQILTILHGKTAAHR